MFVLSEERVTPRSVPPWGMADYEVVRRWNAEVWLRDTYLGGPCPIASHPVAIHAGVSIGVFINSTGGEGPLPFKDRILQKGLDNFKRIAIEQHDRFFGLISVEGDDLHLPCGCFWEVFHPFAECFRGGKRKGELPELRLELVDKID